MARSLFSPSWHRVTTLRPRLRGHLRIYRQHFRDEVWHVLQDTQAGQYHRLSTAAYLMLSLMDGRRTMQEIWEAAGRKLGRDQPTQDEAIQLLTQLHMGDLLSSNVMPDLGELDTRGKRLRKQQMLARIRNPLALRFPLIDPDAFLDRTTWLARPFFSLFGLLAWLVLVGVGVTLMGLHWPALTTNLADRVLTAENLVLIALVYPVLKAIHELGHGYAIKRWGGEVHEMGVMLLVLMPVPYVEASASLAFPEKGRRMVVGAAGIMVELALAAAAMIVWLNVEDGWVKAAAFNVMLIGGASTLFFNGNPLLRFDGYYVLCDLIESPNLGTRANRYFFYLVQRYLFGVADAEPPPTARGERGVLLVYAVAAFIYRVAIMIAIALFIATKFFFIGIALAIWSIFSLLLLPVLKGARFLVTSHKLRNRRAKAISVVTLGLGIAAALLFAVPVPYATIVQGVVLSPQGTQLRVETDGTVEALLARSGTMVEAGQPLLRMSNSELLGRLAMMEAERHEFAARLDASFTLDRVSVQLIELQQAHIEAEITTLNERIEALTVAAPVAGRLILPREEGIEGRWLPRGTQIGVVAPASDPLIRVVAHQNDVDLIRTETIRVDIKFADEKDLARPARLAGFSPSAVDRLPSRALAQSGGGDILVHPADPDGLRPLREVFEFDLRLHDPAIEAPIGQRVHARFDHGDQPVFWRLWRDTRQLLLGVLDVAI